MKINREFVSRVPGQVCSPEVEAEIARPLKQVRADLTTRQFDRDIVGLRMSWELRHR